jgi:hypothetical protein
MYCRDTTDAATQHIALHRSLSHYFNSYTTPSRTRAHEAFTVFAITLAVGMELLLFPQPTPR